ncbi:hypothetical protein VTO73DRAFT_466 [Trametes versicolor]
MSNSLGVDVRPSVKITGRCLQAVIFQSKQWSALGIDTSIAMSAHKDIRGSCRMSGTLDPVIPELWCIQHCLQV